jgi:hypothetical protein
VRSVPRTPVHSPLAPRGFVAPSPSEEEPEDEERFVNRPCYEFNPALRSEWNDKHCAHCRHYLTARCPHIDEFLEDVEDLSPE